MHAWWESISKAQSRIQTLTELLPCRYRSTVVSLADTDRPALSLLLSLAAYSTVASSLVLSPSSGSGSDPLCHWLYDTFFLLPSDPHLLLITLSFLPLLSEFYLLHLHRSPSPPSLAGFEAVLLAVYSKEVKFRGGKPNLVEIPDLSNPSHYHSPRVPNPYNNGKVAGTGLGVLSRPLEPQNAVNGDEHRRLNNMMSDHGIFSRERLLIPISNPGILIDATCYIELANHAKREVSVVYLEGSPNPDRINSLQSKTPSSEHGKKKIPDSLKRT